PASSIGTLAPPRARTYALWPPAAPDPTMRTSYSGLVLLLLINAIRTTVDCHRKWSTVFPAEQHQQTSAEIRLLSNHWQELHHALSDLQALQTSRLLCLKIGPMQSKAV